MGQVAYLFLLLSWGKVEHSLNPFDNHAVCHTTAFTHGLKAVATTSTLQFVQEDGGKTRAGSSQWMAYGNCPAVDVDPLHVRAGLTLPGQHHTGECFIQLLPDQRWGSSCARHGTYDRRATWPEAACPFCRFSPGRR